MPKDLYEVRRDYDHGGQVPAVGVLVVNLGTPEAPTAQALKPYLRQFLGDPRVIEYSRPLWWVILNFIVLTFRPKKSAELYKNVWTEEGSPLLLISQKITAALEKRLQSEVGSPLHCALGMTYGNPSIPSALAELREKGCTRIVMLPLYPHYSATSTGSVFDAVMKELMTWRWVPEVRTIHQFHDDPAYISALADTVREHRKEHKDAQLLLTSYHGIPLRYILNGDPYHCQCHKTTRLMAEELGLTEEEYLVTFQSRFNKEPWLHPYTDVTLEALPEAGIKRIDVICPGFSADCLETIDEVGREGREDFLGAGGEELNYIPCLNDSDAHIDVLSQLIHRNLGGWVQSNDAWDEGKAKQQATQTRDLAAAMKACPAHPDAGYGSSQSH